MLNTKPVTRGVFYVAMLFVLLACGGAQEREQKYLERGKEFFDANNLDKAHIEFKNVIQINPKSSEGIYYIARIEEEKKQYRRALAGYAKTLELAPSHMLAGIGMARIYMWGNMLDQSLESITPVLQTNPENTDALSIRAGVYVKQGKLELALNDVRKALDIDPDHIGSIALLSRIYISQQQKDKAEALLKSSVSRSPENIGLRGLLVQFYAETGSHESAIEELNIMIELKPGEYAFRKQLASLYNRLEKTEQAEQVLRQAVKDLPDLFEVKKSLIDYLAEKRDLMFAQKELSHFQKLEPDNLELKLISARLYQKTSDYDQAEEIYKKIIDKPDDDAAITTAQFEYAKLLVVNKRVDEAKQYLQVLLNRHPGHSDGLTLRGMLALNETDVETAIADFRTILKDQPSSISTMKLLAQAYLMSGNKELAEEQLINIVKESPVDLSARYELSKLLFARKEYNDVIAHLNVIQKIKPDLLDAQELLFDVYYVNGDFSKAMELAQSLQEKHVDNAVGFYYAGLILQAEKKYKASIDKFITALDKKPNAIEPLSAMIRSALMSGQEKRAIDQLKKIIANQNEHAVAHNLLGEVYSSQKKHKLAISSYKSAIETAAGWWLPYRNLAASYLLLEQKQQAIETYQQGIQSSEIKDRLLINLASLYEQQGKIDLAIKLYEDFLITNPGSLVASNNLALLLVEHTKDKSSLDKALSLVEQFQTSRNANFLDTLGWVHYRRGELEQALGALLQAAQMAPESLLINYHLGSVYFSKGDMDEARKFLEPVFKSEIRFKGRHDVQRMMDEIKQQA